MLVGRSGRQEFHMPTSSFARYGRLLRVLLPDAQFVGCCSGNSAPIWTYADSARDELIDACRMLLTSETHESDYAYGSQLVSGHASQATCGYIFKDRRGHNWFALVIRDSTFAGKEAVAELRELIGPAIDCLFAEAALRRRLEQRRRRKHMPSRSPASPQQHPKMTAQEIGLRLQAFATALRGEVRCAAVGIVIPTLSQRIVDYVDVSDGKALAARLLSDSRYLLSWAAKEIRPFLFEGQPGGTWPHQVRILSVRINDCRSAARGYVAVADSLSAKRFSANTLSTIELRINEMRNAWLTDALGRYAPVAVARPLRRACSGDRDN